MYTFSNTERTNKKASEYETKSLLYLIGQRRDKQEVFIAAIDCFNDVTGISKTGEKLWDIQSKGEANLSPRKLGRHLITLFNNYDSNFSFFDYIFFMPKINVKYLNDGAQGVFGISGFKSEQAIKVKEGLVQEILKSGATHSEESVSNFLGMLTLVEDRKNTSTYVKDIVRFKNQSEKENKFYDEIFKEIRDIQSAKKNSFVEGESIEAPLDVLDFDRHILVDDLKMLVVNRFTGVDLFDQRMMPPSFLDVVNDYRSQDLQDLILDCKSQIGRAFFDKNQRREFWSVFEHIISTINSDPLVSVSGICDSLDDKVIRRLSHLNDNGLMFLSAMIKDGLNEN
ncbi:hypothetical protein OAE19_02780 [Porticoccaceae bacterium]|nr:hypothetical protein [Porticoccaceae bacterium]